MFIFVASGNCLTFINRFWESKLPSIPFNMESPAMQMVPSGHLFGVLLDGRFSSSVTGVTEIRVFSSGFSGIAFLFCLLFRYSELCSARIFLNYSEMLRLSLWGESTIITDVIYIFCHVSVVKAITVTTLNNFVITFW